MKELTFLKELILINHAQQECNICEYWYFLDKGFKFQPYICNGCHVLMMSMNLITRISKSEAVNFRQKANLNKKSRTL